jgi:hypothetical protein
MSWKRSPVFVGFCVRLRNSFGWDDDFAEGKEGILQRLKPRFFWGPETQG